MKKYLMPLGVFAGGQIVALLAFLFLGAIGTVTDTLATQSSAYASTFWNWDMVTGTNVKFLVFVLIELLTLFGTAKAFLAVR